MKYDNFFLGNFFNNLASNDILKAFATHISYQEDQPNTFMCVIISHYNTFETFSLCNIMYDGQNRMQRTLH